MKIFLAGGDNGDFRLVAHLLKYPFRLCSYFYQSGQSQERSEILLTCANDGSEWIMDSGLFSFMFGSEKGTLTTLDQYKAYAVKYVETMKRWNWRHAIVECDVQRVLGVTETNIIRDEVFRPSGLETIYVWHIPEGEQGLRNLAKTEKRIALSVPELRQVYGSGPPTKTALIRLLRIIRETGASPRVHLLGNTERPLMDLPADSCDSSSWQGAGRYGTGIYYDPPSRLTAQASTHSPKWAMWRKWCEHRYSKEFEAIRTAPFCSTAAAKEYYANVGCSAIAYWMMMEAHNANEAVKAPHQ